MDKCPDQATLEALVRGTLSPAEQTAVEDHLAACRMCARAAADSPLHDALVADLQALGRWQAAIEPALRALKDVEEHVTTSLFGAPPPVT